jgi:hypothetical protein
MLTDKLEFFHNMPMKKGVFLVLFAVLLSILSPVSINITPTAEGMFLMSLDVCHSGNPSSVSPQSPFIFENVAALYVHEGITSVDGLTTLFRLFITTARIDRPPQA